MKKSFRRIAISVMFAGTMINSLLLITSTTETWVRVVALVMIIIFVGGWILLRSEYDDVLFKTYSELLAEKQSLTKAKKAHETAEKQLLNKVLHLK